MKRIRVHILNRNKVYTYGLYRRKSTAELMKINPSIVSPDLILESTEQQDYVLDTSEEASGLSAPKVLKTETRDEIHLSVEPNEGSIYYYGTVAMQYGSPVSQMEISSAVLKQDEEQINSLIHMEDETPLKTFQKEVSLKKDEICESKVPGIAEEDIGYDLDDIIISNDVIINLPNIWYDVNKIYNYRPYLPLYISAVSGQATSQPTKLFSQEDYAYIPLEKIEILRKDITDSPEDTLPDEEGGPLIHLVKVLLLKDGAYFERGYEKFPLNVMDKNNLICVFNENNKRNTLSVSDKVEHEKIYKYTIRTFDRFKKSSEPSVLILRT